MIPKSYTEEDLREKFKVLLCYLLIASLNCLCLNLSEGLNRWSLMDFQVL